MTWQQEYELNSATYQRIKESIAKSYPRGWFVGIGDEKIVGAAATFQELERELHAKNIVLRKVLVVEAGVAYPEFVTVLRQDAKL
jgi:hypothetical protein